jgi:hypothetical protein
MSENQEISGIFPIKIFQNFTFPDVSYIRRKLAFKYALVSF